MTFLWALWWVAWMLVAPITVGYVTFRYWAWSLMQADSSPWQYIAYFASPLLSLAAFGVVMALCMDSINR